MEEEPQEEPQEQQRRPLIRKWVPEPQQQAPEKKERIPLWMAGCLVAVAVLIDLIQAITTAFAIGAFLSPLISVAASMLYWIWYKMLGISFVGNPKQLATFTTECFLEIVPVADALPMWSIGTIITIIITRSEDKGGIIGQAANMAKPLMGNKAA